MTQSVRDLENTFARAWRLLLGNWVIIIPGVVLGLVGGAVGFLIALAFNAVVITGNGSAEVAYVTQAIVTVVLTLVGMLIAILQMAYVTGMAGAAWKHGRTSLADGWYAFSHRSIQTTFAIVLLFVIGICAAALAPVTFQITLIAYVVFFIYTLASVIIGGREATAALAESCRLALANFMPTLGVVALIALIAVAGSWIGSLLGRVTPFGGGLVAGVLQQVIVAYASLVIAGEYLKLSKQPTA